MVDRHSRIYQETNGTDTPFCTPMPPTAGTIQKRTPTPPKTSADNEVVTKYTLANTSP